MVTPDELGQVPLFAELDAAQRERLSRLAADISLVAGEYAAPRAASRRCSPCSRGASSRCS